MSRDETVQKPPAKKSFLLMGSDSESEDEGLDTDNPSRRLQSRALREHGHMSMLIVVPAVN